MMFLPPRERDLPSSPTGALGYVVAKVILTGITVFVAFLTVIYFILSMMFAPAPPPCRKGFVGVQRMCLIGYDPSKFPASRQIQD